ncbi:succinyl-diaminopimelate desuccinylase [Nesterenkonia sandarakina]|uniref:Succinyl-diaminopimelate desuccinylase n=1 Tax=Nesterenkonia sandarakina TaxID=272918 RepID=A0A7Z0E9V4_9MICC|nr:succinyl-diaminopimelate desuccinylase [Nesterenkonia sandarakina]NYJ17084.1 succinyl-diaminopimelate desuccinylase [Nesterenkonia sandarakina]
MDIRALLSGDVAALTEAIIACESVSGNEKALADAVESALQDLGGLSLHRDGDTIIARTETGAGQRIILAGHLDTVPLPSTPGSRGTVPPSWEQIDGEQVLYGRGATDMKGGVAVQLKLADDVAAHLAAGGSLDRDITWVFYDHEEVEASKSGLGRVMRSVPELLDGDFAVLLEPTHGVVEGGCNGTCRFEVTIPGVAAHSGRAWMGENAIHGAAGLLQVLSDYTPQTITVEGLDYREGLNAVRIRGGVAGNVIPDSTVVEINYRFAPDKTEEQAHAHVREVLAEAGISAGQQKVTDSSSAARPGLDHPAAQAFIAAVGGEPMPKYGWTDVARFSAQGVPAVNFGPGDPLLAHSDDEHVTAQALRDCHTALHRWLLGG